MICRRSRADAEDAIHRFGYGVLLRGSYVGGRVVVSADGLHSLIEKLEDAPTMGEGMVRHMRRVASAAEAGS